MYNLTKKLISFHEQHVHLTNNQRDDMRKRRDANTKRIQQGLSKNSKPSFAEVITQGSYAQKTMVQPPEQDKEHKYDIDMGIVFEESDAKTPQTMKQWVKDALVVSNSEWKHPPECKKKCVRVTYADGYQCDFPVFRRTDVSGWLQDKAVYEIADGADWVKSDPRAMNLWIDDKVADSPNVGGSDQLRRIIRLIKHFAKTHAAQKDVLFPSGLLITALVIENYRSHNQRDDISFRETLRNIANRSSYSAVRANGVIISEDKHTVRIGRLIDQAESAVSDLDKLDQKTITENEALRLWGKVLQHSFFDGEGELETKSISDKQSRPDSLDQAIELQRETGNSYGPWRR